MPGRVYWLRKNNKTRNVIHQCMYICTYLQNKITIHILYCYCYSMESIVSHLFIEIHIYSAFILTWMLCFFQSFNIFFQYHENLDIFQKYYHNVNENFLLCCFFPQWISVLEYCHHHLISNKSSLVREFLRESVVSSQNSFIWTSYIFCCSSSSR